jgi:hypothetical protein
LYRIVHSWQASLEKLENFWCPHLATFSLM